MSAFLELEARAMREDFDRRPFALRHRLCAHPLFALPRLLALARRLPPECIETNAGDLPVDQDPRATPRNGLSAEETLRRIAQCGSWMVLKNVQRDPDYAALLQGCLAELRAPDARLAQGFVFVSSPGAVTPFHMDPEHNFLLQVAGRKTIHVFDPADREVLAEEDLERFHAGAHRNLPWREAWQPRARAFALGPGDGVHVPVTAPHWVRNGDAVSVSFSVTFRSRASERRAQVYAMNARLRRRGRVPAPVGASALRDALKGFSLRLIRRAERLLARPATR
ncbi:MAG TPA: cupin-like domain-containing protein [Burkholderiales bacterium]|nr:cupin-like domain-containing protein [Burkholderiales bacterium]